jgi:hypothetical protein
MWWWFVLSLGIELGKGFSVKRIRIFYVRPVGLLGRVGHGASARSICGQLDSDRFV